MIDIQAGDVVQVLPVGSCPFSHDPEDEVPEMIGKTYRVIKVLPPNVNGVHGLALGVGPDDDYCAGCVRKVEKSDLSFKHWMKTLAPKQPTPKLIADAQGAVSEG